MTKFEPMRLNTEAGASVAFMDCDNGWPGEAERCRELGMKDGDVFTVDFVDVGQSSSRVYLREFKGNGWRMSFNTVLFRNTDPFSAAAP